MPVLMKHAIQLHHSGNGGGAAARKFSAANSGIYTGAEKPAIIPAADIKAKKACELLRAAFPKTDSDCIDEKGKWLASLSDESGADVENLVKALSKIDRFVLQAPVKGNLSCLVSRIMPMSPKLYSGSISDRIFLVENLAGIWKAEMLTGPQIEQVWALGKRTFRHNPKNEEFWNFVKATDTTHIRPIPFLKGNRAIERAFGAYLKGEKLAYCGPQLIQDDQARSAYRDALHKAMYYFCVSSTMSEANLAVRAMRILNSMARIALSHADRKAAGHFLKSMSTYMLHHGITRDECKGALESMFPAIRSQRKGAIPLFVYGWHEWGRKFNEWGIADFACLCYISRVSPLSINRMILALRQVPTADYFKFNQNRVDTLTLLPRFCTLREIIHDQQPHAHDLVAEMVAYYDDKNHGLQRLQSVLSKIEYAKATLAAEFFGLASYDMEFDSQDNSRKGEKEVGIEVLRRLEKNTAAVSLKPPLTENTRLNRLMQKLSESEQIDKRNLEHALKCANDSMVASMRANKFGVEPEFVNALSWLERQAFMALQGVKFEEQAGICQSGWFHELLRFNELTFSARKFDGREFRAFIRKLKKAQTESMEEARSLVFERVASSIFALARIYSKEGSIQMKDALWSGNVSHELLGLVDLRPATTAVGERYRRELQKPPWERNTGD